MDEQAISEFTAITNSSRQVAERYLSLSDGNLEQAMQLYFDSGGLDLEQDIAPTTSSWEHPPTQSVAASTAQQPTRGGTSYTDENGVVVIDSDDEVMANDEQETTAWRSGGVPRQGRDMSSQGQRGTEREPILAGTENDEDIARRMQEELFAGGDMVGDSLGPGGVRAPIARTTETLVGSNVDWEDEGDDGMARAVEAQMAARRRLQGTSKAIPSLTITNCRSGRPGIFNQRATNPSVWDESTPDPNTRRRVLSQATGGASETSSKATTLAEMYRPPVEIIRRLPWDNARQEGRASEKWLLVNVQDPAIFDCQVLNRDIWKDKQIQDTVKENFIFMQYNKDDPRGAQYIQFYFRERDDDNAYPHIAIVDPRTGEQVKVWSGPPIPKPMDFLMELHEFLDRYSLKANAKNPISTRRAEKQKAPSLDMSSMTDEQMLEMALQNSLAADSQLSDGQADVRKSENQPSERAKAESKQPEKVDTTTQTPLSPNGHTSSVSQSASPFSAISSSNPHVEPPANPASTTRIQFRHSGGRVIRRFALTDPVRRIYEWLKAEPLEGKAGAVFELVSAGRNLIQHLDETIEEAGLKNQTVMIEFVEEETGAEALSSTLG